MPFGVRNGAQTFQRFINEVVTDLSFVFVYLDDILVMSTNVEEHKTHLRTLFNKLQSYGININPNKCIFGVDKLEFLGHVITAEGITPSEDRIKSIKDFPSPNSPKKLQRFLGMINFYHRFVPHLAQLALPLYSLLKNTNRCKRKIKSNFNWTNTETEAFNKIKEAFQQRLLLTHPHPNAKVSLCVDASSNAIGAVLQQYNNNRWEPLGFFSQKLKNAELKYSTFDRELLAIYLSIKHFRHLLEGSDFIVFTDHKPLTTAIFSKTEKSPRQTRHLDFVSQFTTDIRYIKGASNKVADALSRMYLDKLDYVDLNANSLAQEQAIDDELNNLIERGSQGSYALKKILLPFENKEIWCDTTTNSNRPYIPQSLRRCVFNTVHGLSHPGIRTTRKLITSRFFWPNMNKDINLWSKTCISCQKGKIGRHTKSPVGSFVIPKGRFEHIHMDLVGPLPPSNGHTYLLTIKDRFSAWPEAIPLRKISASTVIHAFINNWVSRYGVPCRITTDQGTQFKSSLFKEISSLLGNQQIHTSTYHPQSNGLVERFHRQLKASIMTSPDPKKWYYNIPWILLGIRSAIIQDINMAPAQLLYGQALRLPGELIADTQKTLNTIASPLAKQLQEAIQNIKPCPPRQRKQNNFFVHKDLDTCSHVFVRQEGFTNILRPPYTGPFKVLKRTRKLFIIDIAGKKETISIDRVKPAYVLNEQLTDNATNT